MEECFTDRFSRQSARFFIKRRKRFFWHRNRTHDGSFIEMPPQTAKELLAFHQAGSLDILTLGAGYKMSFLTQDGSEVSAQERGDTESLHDRKIIFQNGEMRLECDVVVRATGQNFSLLESAPLFKSMHKPGLASTPERKLYYADPAEYKQKKAEMVEAFGPEITETILRNLTSDEDGRWFSAPQVMLSENNMPLDAAKNRYQIF